MKVDISHLKSYFNFYSENLVALKQEPVKIDSFQELETIDKFQITNEIDLFVSKNKETYKKYLTHLLERFELITRMIAEFEPEYIIDARQHGFGITSKAIDTDKGYLISIIVNDVNFIIDHLKGILQPNTPAKEQPKPTKPPTGQQTITREQTALLFFYLRETRLIKQTDNQDLAAAISLLTGYSVSQIEQIIKVPETPVNRIGKGSQRITKRDFRGLISELNKLIARIEKDLNKYHDELAD